MFILIYSSNFFFLKSTYLQELFVKFPCKHTFLIIVFKWWTNSDLQYMNEVNYNWIWSPFFIYFFLYWEESFILEIQ